MPFSPDPLAETKASAFVNTAYRPADRETKSYIEVLTDRLGLPRKEHYLKCVASVVAACQLANETQNPLIAFSMNSSAYAGKDIGYRVAKETLEAMKEAGNLELDTDRQRGRARCYSFHYLELDGRYTSHTANPVEVRLPKASSFSKSQRLTRRECISRFGSQFIEEENRVNELNSFLESHQLSSPTGVTWGAVNRIFNNGSMNEGGRLYGFWQNLKVEGRLELKIDDCQSRSKFGPRAGVKRVHLG